MIGLDIGAVVVAIDWIKTATEERKGCFMLKTIDGKTTSCKVAAYSCVGIDSNNCQSSLSHYNVTLMSIHLSQQADSNTLKKDICSVLEIDPKDMKSKLNEIVEDKFEKTSQFLAERDSLPSIKICDLKDD